MLLPLLCVTILALRLVSSCRPLLTAVLWATLMIRVMNNLMFLWLL